MLEKRNGRNGGSCFADDLSMAETGGIHRRGYIAVLHIGRTKSLAFISVGNAAGKRTGEEMGVRFVQMFKGGFHLGKPAVRKADSTTAVIECL